MNPDAKIVSQRINFVGVVTISQFPCILRNDMKILFSVIGIGILLVGGYVLQVSQTSESTYAQTTNTDPEKDGPTVIITAPKTIKIGGLIVIDASKSDGTGFDFKVFPEPKYLRVDSDGKRIYCGTGNTHTEFLFIVSCAKNGKSKIGLHRIKIIGKDLPPVEVTVTDLVLDWFESVDSDMKIVEANRLGQSFSSIATLIENGTLTTPEQIINATAKSNVDALGENLAAWKPFLDALIIKLDRLAEQGKLTTSSQHAVIWREVATALKTME